MGFLSFLKIQETPLDTFSRGVRRLSRYIRIVGSCTAELYFDLPAGRLDKSLFVTLSEIVEIGTVRLSFGFAAAFDEAAGWRPGRWN